MSAANPGTSTTSMDLGANSTTRVASLAAKCSGGSRHLRNASSSHLPMTRQGLGTN